ncbi:MAG TPA: SDR family oxidoreductase [Candidatus Binatia bacterium]|nr:SDR family oxidoreductase [Candidatus Binatia bacterium]
MKTTQDLAGKVAIITGGGTGIGCGIAVALAREGVRVAVCGRRAQPLRDAVQKIESQGGETVAIPADVSVEQDVDRLVGEVQKRWGAVDILVNNAGIGGGGRVHEHDVAAWDHILAVNLRGPFLMARAVLPEMRRRGAGHIVNISSESGLEHYEGDGAYGVSKHALNALGEIMQRENQELGIRIDTICPGMVVTEMSQGSPGLDESKCLYPEDIADLVVWLLSRRGNTKIGRPILIQTMENPWQ